MQVLGKQQRQGHLRGHAESRDKGSWGPSRLDGSWNGKSKQTHKKKKSNQKDKRSGNQKDKRKQNEEISKPGFQLG